MQTEESIKVLWRKVMTELKEHHPTYYKLLLDNGYRVGVRFKHNNSFGWANGVEKLAIINLFLHRNSNDSMVVDTMWHELAHCIDYCKRGWSDHGPKWKAIASEIGATPERISKRAVKVEYKYVCVFRKSNVEYIVLKGYHRKPPGYKANSVMADTFQRGNKEGSYGKVWLYTWDKWKDICKQLGKSPYKEEN